MFNVHVIRGPPGDLFVYLEVEEIPEIQRDGINLNSTVTISYLDAILGAVVKVILQISLISFALYHFVFIIERIVRGNVMQL